MIETLKARPLGTPDLPGLPRDCDTSGSAIALRHSPRENPLHIVGIQESWRRRYSKEHVSNLNVITVNDVVPRLAHPRPKLLRESRVAVRPPGIWKSVGSKSHQPHGCLRRRR